MDVQTSKMSEFEQVDAAAEEMLLPVIQNNKNKLIPYNKFMKKILEKIANGGIIENNYIYLTYDGHVVSDPIGPVVIGTGGGGNYEGNNAALTVANTTGWISKTISDSDDCNLSFTWNSVESEMQTGNGSVNIKVNGTSKAVKNIQQGDIVINIKDYLGIGENIVRVTISDVYGNSRTLSYNVEVVAFSLTSTFDDAKAYSGDITFPYTPTGSATKTMQFVLDGSLIGSVEVTASGRQQNFKIPAQSHGSHTFEVYFTANINENAVESNHLYYDIIFVENGNRETVIASSFNAKGVSQFYSVSIPYLVYTPNSNITEIELCANGEVVQTLSVDRTKQIWTYRADNVGDLLLEIVSGEIRKQFHLTVNETDIDVSAEENDLDIYLTAYGRSNNEANPSEWRYGNIEAALTGFNFVSDGWQFDDDANTVLRVKGDARVTIPLNIFESDIRGTGKTIEFEFATRDVLDYEAEIIRCFENNKGVIFTPQKAALVSEQSSISRQYKEDEHVRVSFVVEKSVENRLILMYINGVLSGSVQYPDSDDFQQSTPVGITIGSNDCTIDLYCIRVYSNNLTRYQMLDNWIADTQNGYEMLRRYNHNNIYDAYGQILISKLPSNLPYLVLEGVSLPQYKGDKKTVSGYYVDPVNTEKSFRFEGATIDVQGTSSQYYKRKNYKIKFKNGFIMEVSGETIEKYQMRENSIPVNTFTFKADVASCEGANNVELVRLYDDICPYKTPPQVENSDIRQGIDGFPIVVFWNNGNGMTFLGKYNFNNDKGTEEVFGFDSGDESWEIKNNTSARSMFKSADFSGNSWIEDFEGRYPDGNTDPSNLAELSAWLVSTDQTQATNAALEEAVIFTGVEYTTDSAEYRLEKFKAECDNWLAMDSIIFSYIFTELFLMVDSRAKNNFPTFYSGGKWCVLPYDMDTAIGTNNEGLLVFDYNLEDADTVNGSNVFNGQDSVLYINTRDAFQDRIAEMYGKLRSDGLLSYEEVERRFSEHQAVWPEAIFNEDAYYKYIDPLVEDGEGTYLSMCQGPKASQRKWWLFNRFRYIDSKYTAGNAKSSTITLRAYQKSDFEITPYADIYPCVAFDSTLVKKRGRRNEVCTIVSPEAWDPNGSDAVVTVYSANQLKDIGDISSFKVGYADFSQAVKLQSIKVGDAAEGYSNENMTELIVGNNTLLKTIDARNCPKLAMTVDLSGCENLEEAYFDGTAVTGVQLANGGSLKTLHFPDTVNNLTLRNQTKLTDFQMNDYSNVTTLWIENTPAVDSKAILERITVGSRVRLIGFEWTVGDYNDVIELLDLLDTMRGIDVNGGNTDTAELSGIINADSILDIALEEINEKYPNMKVVAKSVIDAYTITQNLDENVNTDNNTPYVVSGNSFTATLTPTSGYEIYSYSVTMGGTDVTSTVYKDGVITISSVTGEVVITVVVEKVSYARKLIQRTLSGSYTNEEITSVGAYAFNNVGITEYHLPNVTTIGTYAFLNNHSLTSLSLPNLETITGSQVVSGKNITKVLLPKLKSAANSCLQQVGNNFVKVDLGLVSVLSTQALHNNSKLQTIILRNPDTVVSLRDNVILSSINPYIYVPSALVESYKTSVIWSSRADYIRAIEDYPDICGEV